jgi:hypothetical protein
MPMAVACCYIMAHIIGLASIKQKAGPETEPMSGLRCYSSKNLYDWKDEGVALAVSDDTTSLIVAGCIIERPKVIYNEKTGKFVMWFHHELKGMGYSAALTGVAVSDHVTGPYTYIRSVNPNANHWPMNYPEHLKADTTTPAAFQGWSQERRDAVRDGMFLRETLSADRWPGT